MTKTISNNLTHNYSQLLFVIKQTQIQMIQSALAKGYTSPETVRISQQLDCYLNLELKIRNFK